MTYIGGRTESAASGGGEQLHVGVRQHSVIAERAAEQVSGHDRHALGVQAAALHVGAEDPQQRRGPGAQHAADHLRLPANGVEGAVKRVVVVLGQPVGALADPPTPPLGVDDEHAGGADHQVIDVGGRAGHGQVVEHHEAVAVETAEQVSGVPLTMGAALPSAGLLGGPKPQPPPDQDGDR
jgi:hypothetical protein